MVRRSGHLRRSGVAIVIVLVFIAMTIAVSYALVRSQFTSLAIEENAGRLQEARDAAWTGIWYGLRQMHTAGWSGVGTTGKQQLEPGVSFSVSYEPGDSSLSVDDPDIPYRVTIKAVGRVAAAQTGVPDTTYECRMVVQLVLRQLSAEPDTWSAMTTRTLTQWDGGKTARIEVPARIEGTAAVQGKLALFQSYPVGNDPLTNYAYGLGQMAAVGREDDRPFGGPVLVGPNARTGAGITLLRDVMGVSTQNMQESDTPAYRQTSVPASYQLYPGGPVYSIPVLGATVGGARFQPDPRSNPLGVYRLGGNLRIEDNVAFDGVLLGPDVQLRLRGRGVEMRAVALPPLADSEDVYSLPVIASVGEIAVAGGAQVTVDGFVLAERRFLVESGSGSTQLALTGRLATAELVVRERSEWPTSGIWWRGALGRYEADKKMGLNGVYFPEYVRDQYGFDPSPQITIKSPRENIRYHWQDWTQPVFVPHPDDDGLRWSIIRWETAPDSN